MGSGQRRTEDTKPQHLKTQGIWCWSNSFLQGDLQEAQAGPATCVRVPWPCPPPRSGRGARQAGYLRF